MWFAADVRWKKVSNMPGEREAFGVPIYQHQAIGHKIADMAINYEASRRLVDLAGGLAGRRRNDPIRGFLLMPRHFAADMATKAAVDAVQVFGGYGYMKEYPVEKAVARCQNIPNLRRHQ